MEAQEFRKDELKDISKLLNELEYRRIEMTLMESQFSQFDTLVYSYQQNEDNYKRIIADKDLVIEEVTPTFLDNAIKYTIGVAIGVIIGIIVN